MIYNLTIDTDENTKEAAPKKTELKLVKGLLYQFDLYFPPGSSGLLGVAVFEQEVQIYPRNRGEYFTGDNITVSFKDLFRIESEMATFTILTYNEDTDYSHVLQLRLGVLSEVDLISSLIPSIFLGEIKEEMDTIKSLLDELKAASVKKGFTLFPRRG